MSLLRQSFLFCGQRKIAFVLIICFTCVGLLAESCMDFSVTRIVSVIDTTEGSYEYVYPFVNSGDSDLVIENINKSCSCIFVSLKKELIRSGEESDITLTLYTDDYIAREEIVTIVTNSPVKEIKLNAILMRTDSDKYEYEKEKVNYIFPVNEALTIEQTIELMTFFENHSSLIILDISSDTKSLPPLNNTILIPVSKLDNTDCYFSSESESIKLIMANDGEEAEYCFRKLKKSDDQKFYYLNDRLSNLRIELYKIYQRKY